MLKQISTSYKKNILIILTGSIACYKACAIISKLKQKNYSLKIILSPSSLEFIGHATVEGLSGTPPITDMYASGQVMDHINLARWADLILVAPATANYINKIAHGLGDDLLTTIFLAHDFTKPFLLAPAMNTKMYLHPTTQASISKLKAMQVEILETASGVLACGEIGSGRLLEPDLIVDEVEKFLNPNFNYNIDSKLKSTTTTWSNTSAKKIKILVTSGGTIEPIDDVRFITNKSTGKTAATIADSLIESGFEVTYLHGQNAIKTKNICEQIFFETFSDLKKILTQLLAATHYNYIIHAAAVSDYSILPKSLHPDEKINGKIDSTKDELTITLKKNPKLINEIKKLNPQSTLFAFKLTSTNDKDLINRKVALLFESTGCDYVIHNDWSDVKIKNYNYQFYNKNSPENMTPNTGVELTFKNIEGLQNLCALIFQEITQTEEKYQRKNTGGGLSHDSIT